MWSPKSTGPLHYPWKPCDSTKILHPLPSPLKTIWFPQNPPSSPIRYPWKPCDPLKSSASLSITPENHMTPTKSSASTLRCRWKPCDSSKSSAPLSVTPENNAIPQNPPPPFITPKNHMTPTKSSASILCCRWKPCDPLKSSVPPLPLEISPKAVGRTIFPLSNLTEEWGGVYVLFTLQHMLEFWVNRTRISTHSLTFSDLPSPKHQIFRSLTVKPFWRDTAVRPNFVPRVLFLPSHNWREKRIGFFRSPLLLIFYNIFIPLH